MTNPSDRKYSDTHEWALIEGDVATIGITSHAAESLSDLVFLDLPEVGDEVSAGEGFGEIESVKAVSDLKSPVSGEVIDVHSELEDNLKDINTDPYGKGWMIKVKVSSVGDGLMDAAAYEQHAAEA